MPEGPRCSPAVAGRIGQIYWRFVYPFEQFYQQRWSAEQISSAWNFQQTKIQELSNTRGHPGHIIPPAAANREHLAHLAHTHQQSPHVGVEYGDMTSHPHQPPRALVHNPMQQPPTAPNIVAGHSRPRQITPGERFQRLDQIDMISQLIGYHREMLYRPNGTFFHLFVVMRAK